jgi:guanosine-3',5'-bis(diphosphate) 3'-pyrophosphohydrolase
MGQLASITAGENTGELWRDLQVDLFRHRIFVFSPKGDLYDLPEGATPVDFAFAVHSEVGLRAQGARVNGRITPLDRPLENRDVVEIITRKHPAPNRSWLSYVKTAHARNRIKNWFRTASRETNIANGRQLLEPKLKAWGYRRLDEIDASSLQKAMATYNIKDTNALLAAIGEGALASEQVVRRLVPQTAGADTEPTAARRLAPTGRAVVTGAPELPCTLASCCQPVPPQSIMGYITRGSGVTVHVRGCANLPKESSRYIDCQWEDSQRDQSLFNVALRIVAADRVGLNHDITAVLANHAINIVKMTSESIEQEENQAQVEISLRVNDLVALSYVMTSLERVTGVLDVSRKK